MCRVFNLVTLVWYIKRITEKNYNKNIRMIYSLDGIWEYSQGSGGSHCEFYWSFLWFSRCLGPWRPKGLGLFVRLRLITVLCGFLLVLLKLWDFLSFDMWLARNLLSLSSPWSLGWSWSVVLYRFAIGFAWLRKVLWVGMVRKLPISLGSLL